MAMTADRRMGLASLGPDGNSWSVRWHPARPMGCKDLPEGHWIGDQIPGHVEQ